MKLFAEKSKIVLDGNLKGNIFPACFGMEDELDFGKVLFGRQPIEEVSF